MSKIAVRYDGDVYELIVDDAPVIAPLRARVASLEAEVKRLREALRRGAKRCTCAGCQGCMTCVDDGKCAANSAGMTDDGLRVCRGCAFMARGAGLTVELDEASAPTGGQGAAASVDRPPPARPCDCGSGKVPHVWGGHESCESWQHHCDGCHTRRICTAAECLAAVGASAFDIHDLDDAPAPAAQPGPGAVCEHNNLLQRCWHCNEHPSDAPAAQPATETCGTCQGDGFVSVPDGNALMGMSTERCPRCTTPRKEGP